MNHTFASDNAAGICPEAIAAISNANESSAASYGEDEWTTDAQAKIRQLFETDCAVYFVFNGTAANALALSSACRSYHGILCHQDAHADTDECGAPEFFTGGSKVIPLAGEHGKLDPRTVEAATHRGHGVHYPKPGAISITQSTELGTVYSVEEVKALSEVSRNHNLALHMDGARFANAVATLHTKSNATPADITWRAGVDMLSFGGTKNGMLTTEAVVIFNHKLAQEFDYRVKQSGQLSSKQRFASAQWSAMLAHGAWLQHAAHANTMALRLAGGLKTIPGCRLQFPTESNGVFMELPRTLADGLAESGWLFYPFGGPNIYRLMCSWDTKISEVDAFIAAANKIAAAK